MLQDNYYRIEHYETAGEQAVFQIALLENCKVYQGHFPGHPICPGVCNIEMIKECASKVIGKSLHVRRVRKCRFTAVAIPSECPFLTIAVDWKSRDDGGYDVTATIADGKTVYVKLKAELE